MSKNIITVLIFSLLISLCKNNDHKTNDSMSGITPVDITTAEGIFKKNCTPCHGDDANVFVDRQWKHGSTKDSLSMSIASGFTGLMPEWGKQLKKEEIAGLAEYLTVAIENRKKFDFADINKTNLFASNQMTVKLDTVAKGLHNPWGIAFLPNGDLLYTDRDGHLYRNSKGVQSEIKGAPPVLVEGQGGLLDVETHPNFAKNNTIYLTYSKFIDSAGKKLSTTALMRAVLKGNELTNAKDIWVGMPYRDTRIHYGSRIEFDKAGYLFLSVGDRFQHLDSFPQRLDVDFGKIHRMNDDGSVPKDNPFVNTPGARPTIWSMGHRNPQGLKIDKEAGIIWEHEHGPRGGDELNIIEKAKNYGWPVISYGINYDGKIITPLTAKEGMEQPKVKWVPSIAPSGITVVKGNKYPAWKGDILMGSLRFKYLNRVHLEGNQPGEQEQLLKNIGRVRFVEQAPDGFIYVGVEEPGFIYKLIPVTESPK